MNEHTGFHETIQRGEVLFRYNPNCPECKKGLGELEALAMDRDIKQCLFELEFRSLILKSEMDSLILQSIGSGEDILKQFPHLEELYNRIANDYMLFI